MGSQPWAYQGATNTSIRGDNVVDFTSNWESHPDAQENDTE
jgi:hypothetical protein